MKSKRRLTSTLRGALASLGMAVALACGDASLPTGDGSRASLALRPRFAATEAPFSGPPVNRIVLSALAAETSEVLGRTDIDVDPGASEWRLSVGVDLRGSTSVLATVELEMYSATSVAWSGRSSPFEVVSGTAARTIDVYRGPLDNLDVASVEVQGAPTQMGVGTSVQVRASSVLIPGSDATPIVFWASADPTVATLTPQGTTTTITAISPGTTRIIAGSGPAMDTVVVDVVQTSRSTLNPPGQTTNWEARTSQTRTGSASIVTYDDFAFAAGASLQGVAWQGIYCREVADAPAPVPVAVSFTVSFHADVAGLPDTTAALYSETVPLARVAETLDLNGPASCGVTPSTTWGLYGYSATLSEPFVAMAGTRYWLSVVANLPSTDLYWGWRAGTPDNDGSVQLFGGQFTTYGRDRAFALSP